MDLQDGRWDRRFVYWIDLTQNRDRWRGLVNEVTNNRFQNNAGDYLTS